MIKEKKKKAMIEKSCKLIREYLLFVLADCILMIAEGKKAKKK
jgi:hypothetical protein